MKNQNQLVKEAEQYLDQIPKFSKEKHTVDTVRQMLALLDNPQENQKIIHVAGTNGKGSVCAFLTSILKSAGHSVAVFTSPHLLSVKERFAFDGQEVDDETFLYSFDTIKGHIGRFEQAGLGHPSYFEFMFLMFMVMLKARPMEYVVLETGLGGRLDATNAIEHPLVTVITSISLDHMEYLGNTTEKIAGEKAGIIKYGVPVVYDNTDAPASAVIEKKAGEMKSAAYPVDWRSYTGLALKGGHLNISGVALSGETIDLDIPFAAEYQAINSMLAVRTAELLDISPEAIEHGVKKTIWPGRMEQIQENVYLDGAHNEGGIRAFAKAARTIAAGRKGRKLLLFAVVSDKEYKEMAEILCEEFEPDVLVLTQIGSSRALDVQELQKASMNAFERVDERRKTEAGEVDQAIHDIRVTQSVRDAFETVMREKRPEDTVFCAGSLYLIGEIKEVLRRNEE